MVLVDCYNSNPSSLRAAVDTLAAMPRRGGRVAVIGTMLELGPRSAEIHREAAGHLVDSRLDLVVASGAFYEAFEPFAARMGDRLVRVHDPLEAMPALEARLAGNEIVLLKGSRGVALERLLPLLQARWGSAPATPTSGGGEAAARGGD